MGFFVVWGIVSSCVLVEDIWFFKSSCIVWLSVLSFVWRLGPDPFGDPDIFRRFGFGDRGRILLAIQIFFGDLDFMSGVFRRNRIWVSYVTWSIKSPQNENRGRIWCMYGGFLLFFDGLTCKITNFPRYCGKLVFDPGFPPVLAVIPAVLTWTRCLTLFSIYCECIPRYHIWFFKSSCNVWLSVLSFVWR